LVQSTPASVDFQSPEVPYPSTVYMTSGVMGSMTRLHGRPELRAAAFCPVLIRVQVTPQSVERNMPFESAPA
jgi:hypothetical protein